MILSNLRYEIRSLLGLYPQIYLPLQRLRPSRRHMALQKNSEITIEGYPRSGNTYAVATFMIAQESPVSIAHHLHVPAQVVAAVKRKIPTLVIIRNPEDAVLSFLLRDERVTPSRALKDYVLFYEKIMPYRQGFVLATFESVTKKIGTVMEYLNRRFDTHFKVFESTEENNQKVFQLIESMDKADTGSNAVTATTIGMPSPEREEMKKKRGNELRTQELESLLAEALATYENTVKFADVT